MVAGRPSGCELVRQTVIGLGIEERVEALHDRKLLLLQMQQHLRNEIPGHVAKFGPSAGAGAVRQQFGGKPGQAPRERPDHHVLLHQQFGELVLAMVAEEREEYRFLEDIVLDHLPE